MFTTAPTWRILQKCWIKGRNPSDKGGTPLSKRVYPLSDFQTTYFKTSDKDSASLHLKTQQKSLVFLLQIQHFCCIMPLLYKKGGRDEIQ